MKIAGTPVIVFTLYEKNIVGVALILKGNYFFLFRVIVRLEECSARF